MKDALISLLKGRHTISDVWHYFLGNYRYHFYYGGKWSKKYAFIAYLRKKMIRVHIKEQIAFRIKVMNPQCYEQGSCIKCGCETTALQMANKSCDGDCYPPMMNKVQWKRFRKGGHSFIDGDEYWYIGVNGNLYKTKLRGFDNPHILVYKNAKQYV